MCTSRNARQRSSAAISRRSTCASAGSSASVLARRARASASHPSCPRFNCSISHPNRSGRAQRAARSRARANPHSCRIASMHVMWKADVDNCAIPFTGLTLCPLMPEYRALLCCDPGAYRVFPGRRPRSDCPGARGTVLPAPRLQSMQRAAELAVKESTPAVGFAAASWRCGVMDDSGRPEVAIRIAEQLVDDPAGRRSGRAPRPSGTSLAAVRVYGEARRPIANRFPPSASSPTLRSSILLLPRLPQRPESRRAARPLRPADRWAPAGSG